MYLDFLIPIPSAPGKITRKKKEENTYINFEYARTYDPVRKFNIPQRVTIGKESKADPSLMQPNQNFLRYFPGVDLPEERSRSARSSCLRVGAFIVLRKIIEEYKLLDVLGHYFSPRERDLFLDLMVYSIVTESNAAQHYPDYGYNHPLFSSGMKIYSDSKVSAFLRGITQEQRVGFLNEWNDSKDHREKIYISYDSTNKNCQAGDIRMVEYGHAKEDRSLPIFNYSIAYDTENREPLFYEEYAGSIVDVSQLQYMLAKARGYGYKRVGFILDRGYFSREIIAYMDQCSYDFVIMVKGMSPLVNEIALENKGRFENDRDCNIRKFGVFGTTVKRRLYATDEKERYFHIYYNDAKKVAENEVIEVDVERMAAYLKAREGTVYDPGNRVRDYFEPFISEKDGVFLFAREKKEAIERKVVLCGYFCIVTSQKMTAREAIELYKSRDASEKLFKGDKTYLGNRSMRVYTDESVSAKIFIEFVALIVRSRFYRLLKDANEKLENRQNYMNVPAAIRELEKIEMIRGLDGLYRLDHAVTATQKTILSAFGITVAYLKDRVNQIREALQVVEERR